MHLEVFGMFGILILLLIILAEATKAKKTLGVLASLLLLMLGLMVFTEGVQRTIGQTDAVTISEFFNATSNETFTNKTTNSTVIYTDIAVPYVDFNDFMALLIILLGVFGTVFYAVL